MALFGIYLVDRADHRATSVRVRKGAGMTRKKVIIAIVVVARPRRSRRGQHLLPARAGSCRSRPKPSARAISRRSSRRRARCSRSGRSTSRRNQMGRVTRLAVEEGQRVKAGQFLLEIDPRQLEGQLQRGQACVAAAQSGLLQARVGVESAEANVEQAKASLDLSRQNLKRQQDLWKDGLTTRESLERAQNEVDRSRGRPQGPQQDSGACRKSRRANSRSSRSRRACRRRATT